MPETESPVKLPVKSEEKHETTIKLEKVVDKPNLSDKLQKPQAVFEKSQTSVIDEKPPKNSKTFERIGEKNLTAKVSEDKAKLALEKTKSTLAPKDTKDPKGVLKKAPTKEASSVLKKPAPPTTTGKTTTTTEKKPEKSTLAPKKPTTNTPTPAQKKAAGPLKKSAIGVEETKSMDSKEDVAEKEEGEEEHIEKQEESEEANPESTQLETENENNVEELKALRTELDDKISELLTKENIIKELNGNLMEMAKKIQTMEKEKDKVTNAADFENLNNLKLMQVEQKLKEAERKNKHLENDYSRLKKEFDLQKFSLS